MIKKMIEVISFALLAISGLVFVLVGSQIFPRQTMLNPTLSLLLIFLEPVVILGPVVLAGWIVSRKYQKEREKTVIHKEYEKDG